jgi:branched-chain amino acid transport system ATP-binding protein
MSDPILELRELSAGYGGVAVAHGVSMTLMPGEVVALLGPNGAGKTTTLLTVSGIVKALEGEALLNGRPITGLPAHRISRMGVAHVPEDRSLFFGLTVDENLRLAERAGGHNAFELFPELKPMRSRKAGLLSGGEQQMLTLARALATNPIVMLVDEMSLGLAPIIVERLFSTLHRIAREMELAVLLVEQHVHLALSHADRAYVMVHGNIATEGTVADLKSRWHEVESSYLGHAAAV